MDDNRMNIRHNDNQQPTYDEAELVLEGYTEISNGVGQAFAIPVLNIASQRIQAAEVSRSIKPDVPLVPVLDGYIAVNTLRQAGLGPMGRTIHGAMLDRPFQLTPAEIIARGSERMQGAWSRILFPDLVWPYGSEYPVYEHLKLLSQWGLNGGVRGGAYYHAEELRLFMNDMLKSYPESRILVLGKKALLEQLKDRWRLLDAIWLTAGGKDQVDQEVLSSGVIITTPNVAKQQQITSISFDIILMIEPDDLTKSSTTQIFKQLKKMKSRLKLAIYSAEDYVAQSYVSTTHMNLLKINDYTVSQYVIFNPKQPKKDLPRPYRRMERLPLVQAQEPIPLHMTEMELEGEHGEKGSPIPRREQGQQIEPRSTPIPAPPFLSSFELFKAEIDVQKREHRFTKRARQLENHVEVMASYVPYMNYWPTYDSMTGSQSRWYFYWRGEVRGQRYPDTDLSYLFLYVYELIHGIGWIDVMEGYRLMSDVWMAYRERNPKLTPYLLEWMTDFTLIHGLPLPYQDVYQLAPDELSGDELELELMHRFNSDPLDIPFSLLRRLSDTDMSKSKFYNDGGDILLQEYVPKVIALVDAYLVKQQGLRLIEIFYPGPPVEKERQLFQSATYDECLYGRFVSISVTRISQHAPLREYITQLMRLTENKLREHLNFKGRLRGIELEPEVDTLVSRYLDRMLKTTSTPTREGPAVVIDEEKLAQLQEDSEFVRDILTVNIEDFSEQQEQLPIPSINVVVETDRNDIPIDSCIHWDVAGLPEEWKDFADALSSSQLEVLYVLRQGQGLAALQDIANEAGTMPELMTDDINEIAMDRIGDLIIDGEELTEEYIPMLSQITKPN